MQSARCPTCGAALNPGAQFCAYCGRPVTGATAPPLAGAPTWQPPPGPGPGPGGYGVPAPPPRRRSRLLIVIVIVVVLVLVFAVVAYELAGNADQVNISGINVWSPDNVCGLNTYPISYGGYSTNTSENDSWQFYDIPNANSTACTITHVTTNTSGFQVWAVVPVFIPAGDQNGSLNLSIVAPGSSFNGVLNLVFT